MIDPPSKAVWALSPAGALWWTALKAQVGLVKKVSPEAVKAAENVVQDVIGTSEEDSAEVQEQDFEWTPTLYVMHVVPKKWPVGDNINPNVVGPIKQKNPKHQYNADFARAMAITAQFKGWVVAQPGDGTTQYLHVTDTEGKNPVIAPNGFFFQPTDNSHLKSHAHRVSRLFQVDQGVDIKACLKDEKKCSPSFKGGWTNLILPTLTWGALAYGIVYFTRKALRS